MTERTCDQLRIIAADLRSDDPNSHHRRNVSANVLDKAADEIERLTKENANLKGIQAHIDDPWIRLRKTETENERFKVGLHAANERISALQRRLPASALLEVDKELGESKRCGRCGGWCEAVGGLVVCVAVPEAPASDGTP